MASASMIRSYLLLTSVIFFQSNLLYGQEKTFIREYTYHAGENDSKISSRAIAIAELRSLLLHEIGVYVESEQLLKTVEIDGKFSQDFVENIATISAGITKLEVLEEKWNGEIFFMKAAITINIKEFEETLKQAVNAKKQNKEVTILKKELDDTKREIALLSEQINKLQNEQPNKKNITENYTNSDNPRQRQNQNNNEAINKVSIQDLKKAQEYFDLAINEYQIKKNYKKAFEYTERTLYYIPSDTSILMNAGVFFAPAAGEWDKSLYYIDQYLAKGGNSSDAYIMKFSITRDQKKDNEGALKIAQEMVRKYPNNPEFPKYELDMYVKLNKLPEAKEVMIKQANANPNDKEARYFLGVICYELNQADEAKKWYEEAIKLDSRYYEPQIALAEVFYLAAKDEKDKMNPLGNSKDDLSKKITPNKVYQEKLRTALPYWEKCEKLSPNDGKVLDVLYLIYSDLEMTAQVQRVEKRMKALGLLD